MPKYVPRLEGIMYDPEGTYTQYNNVQYAYYINTLISNLVRTTHFWNNLHKVCSKSKLGPPQSNQQ